ncbi:bifunctional diguanylate cyclase/phosphodiesterase [Litchfieldella xinjiangensis]|uniref:bifunctional diguanylate cyclase/phosphodiesterase n=1 Tax=Litchfieldella xinjiangensis TaxID=1166948 RepID=UPI0005B9DB1F|nr:EAL domain-containing protein [Halomonas xinjiangensis]
MSSVEASTELIIRGNHQAGLLLLGYLVAFLGAYAGLVVGERGRAASTTARHWAWLALGATLLGSGLWSLHFIGLLALKLPFPMMPHFAVTLISVLPAILGGFYALHTLTEPHFLHSRYLLAGSLLGLGISVMHYTGLAGMHIPAQLHYAAGGFMLSLAITMALGILALYASHACVRLARRLSTLLGHVPVAAMLVWATSGMYFVSLSSAYFVPHASVEQLEHSHGTWLIYVVSVGAVLTALAALGAVLVDRRLQQSERERYMSRRQLYEVIASMRDGVLVLDRQARVLMFNRAFGKLTGYTDEELAGQPATRIEYAQGARELNWRIQEYLREHESWQGEVQAQHRSGRQYPARLTISRVDYNAHGTSHYVATLSDMTEQKVAQEKIHHLAYHDPLTDLPNRPALIERLSICQRQSEKTGAHVMLMLIDIDKFKLLNDALGQAMGDRMLLNLAERLQRHVPQLEDLARLDGNEFALILCGFPADAELAARIATKRANHILQDLNTTYDLDGHGYTCRISAGVHVFQGDQDDRDALFRKTGMALLHAKQLGDQQPCLFDPEMERRLDERLQLEADLRHALENDQLELYLQPQVDPRGHWIGAEALVRWNHPERGFVSPGAFIPLAEETGLVVPLGRYVLDRAAALLAEWQHDPERARMRLSVNVSVREFQQPDFVASVLAALARQGAPAERLTLELTESLLLTDVEDVIAKMSQLKAHGIRFSLDDFGTGYSSLAYLRRLPLDELKIDVAFVCDLPASPNAVTIARTIIALAESLDLDVVAEGVETPAQREVLEQLGCGYYQGFLFGRPTPAASLMRSARSKAS